MGGSLGTRPYTCGREQVSISGITSFPKYSASSFFTHDEKRDRKLLLKKSEIRKLIGKIKIKGYALIPTKVYSKKNLIKIELGLGKGKKKYDKRADIKKKEVDKQIRRDFKSKLSI